MMVNIKYVIQALKLSARQALWQKPSMIGSKTFLYDGLRLKIERQKTVDCGMPQRSLEYFFFKEFEKKVVDLYSVLFNP